MKANELIESYVTDVAVQLPRKLRNDVAFELRALLTDELQGRAEAAGRAPDEAMTIDLLRAFGRPSEVAARYRPPLTIIDPADGRAFLRATLVGLAVIWIAGLWMHWQQSVESGAGALHVVGRWWGGTVIPSLWWPGLLVVGFGLAAWAGRRRPQSLEWKPRAGDRIQGGRATLVLGIIGILCGIFLLSDPHWLLDVAWGGRAAPAAYEVMTYTDSFRQHQAPWLFGALALNVPLLIAVLVNGRWSPLLRRLQDGLGLLTCAVMAWTLLDGAVFKAVTTDRAFKLALVLGIVSTLITLAIRLHRRVRPNPSR